MKNHSLSISIPEPCHEDWSEMTTREKGRHCLSCKKTVIDFTRMTKAGIVDHVTENSGEICGRFSPDQLDVNLLPARRNRLFSKWAAVFLGIIPFAGYGQTPIPTSELMEQAVKGKRVINHIPKNDIVKSVLKDGILTGKVIDAETREPIMFGNVVLKNGDFTVRGSETDLDGNFTINTKGGEAIELSYIGYTSLQLDLESITQSNYTGILEMSISEVLLGDVVIVEYKTRRDCDFMGAVAIVSTEAERESWLKRQWKKFKKLVVTSHEAALENREFERGLITEESNSEHVYYLEDSAPKIIITEYRAPSIKVYPNPTISLVNIEMPKEYETGMLQITDSNNQIIHSRLISEPTIKYDGSILISGTYIVSLIVDEQLVASEVFIKI